VTPNGEVGSTTDAPASSASLGAPQFWWDSTRPDIAHASVYATRLDSRKPIRRSALLSFRRVLWSARTLGISVARGARAGKDFSCRADPGRCCIFAR